MVATVYPLKTGLALVASLLSFPLALSCLQLISHGMWQSSATPKLEKRCNKILLVLVLCSTST